MNTICRAGGGARRGTLRKKGGCAPPRPRPRHLLQRLADRPQPCQGLQCGPLALVGAAPQSAGQTHSPCTSPKAKTGPRGRRGGSPEPTAGVISILLMSCVTTGHGRGEAGRGGGACRRNTDPQQGHPATHLHPRCLLPASAASCPPAPVPIDARQRLPTLLVHSYRGPLSITPITRLPCLLYGLLHIHPHPNLYPNLLHPHPRPKPLPSPSAWRPLLGRSRRMQQFLASRAAR